MNSLQVYVICGLWRSSSKKEWRFIADNEKCGRLITLQSSSTLQGLKTMVFEEYNLSHHVFDVEFSYLPSGLIGKSECPPIIVPNDQQVRNLVGYLRKDPWMRLCVTFKSRFNIDLNKEPEGRTEGDANNPMNTFEEDDCDNPQALPIGFKSNKKQKNKSERVPYAAKEGVGVDSQCVYDRNHSRQALYDFKVKQEFSSKFELQSTLEQCAMKYNFDYRVIKSCKRFWIIYCKDNRCNWRARAECLPGSAYFIIKKYVDKHTCAPSNQEKPSRVPSAITIGHLIKKKYECVKEGPRPNDIVNILRTDHGATLSYSKAWRSRECANSLVRGIPEKSFKKIPRYLHMLQKANPGTHASYECERSGRFKYLFISFGQSIRGFYKVIRRVIVIDGTFLKGKYKGVLLVATAQDGNSNLYPIAFGIVDSENNNSWEWFLTQLKVVIDDDEGLVFVSDKNGSIVTSLGKVYPLAKHGICIHHLLNNVVTYFKAQNLASMVAKASKAYRVADFEKKFKRICEISPLLGRYLEEADVKKWARCHFPGYRYNVSTSNPAESINSAQTSSREYPLIPLLGSIREMLTRWFYERREKSGKHKHPLTEEVEKKVSRRIEKGKFLLVLPITDSRFEIKGDDYDYVVDLERRTCSCRKYDLDRIPCRHAIQACFFLGLKTHTKKDELFAVNFWRTAYEESINPIEDPEDEWTLPPDVEDEEVLPPKSRRGAGRSKKRRYETVEDKIRSSQGSKRRRCSRCDNEGHSRTTCKVAI